MSKTVRYVYIDRMIQTKGYVLTEDIWRHFEVSKRTAERDIEYMRDQLFAPIDNSRECHEYRYTEKYDLFSFLDEKKLILYCFLSSIAQSGWFLPALCDEFMQKLKSSMPEKLYELSRHIEYTLSETSLDPLETIIFIICSLFESSRLRFAYQHDGESPEQRTVEVLRIINYHGNWYLIAHDCEKNQVRNFALSRMSDCCLCKEKYRMRYSDEEIESICSSSYGIFIGDEAREVTFRLYGRAAHVSGERVWHEKQSVRKAENEFGSFTEITLPAARYEELTGKLLRFAHEAEAVAPPDFREYWLSRIDAMYKRWRV